MLGSLAAAVGLLTLLTILPGPDTAVVARAALAGGREVGGATAAGVVCGLLVWGLLAVGGLAAVLAASADAYTALRVVGGAYLAWLGLRTLWRSRGAAARRAVAVAGLESRSETGRRLGAGSDAGVVGRRGAWRTGFATNLLNPKIGVFYTGVLPQLVPAGAPTTATQAGLVLAHAGLSLVWLGGWARLLGRSRAARHRPVLRQAIERVGGAVLVGLGVGVLARAR
jgi:threonine/homoserine/homoserine lactone efflux protein